MIRFSIIMPVYNNEKYFPLAVKSIEKQDYDNYELIIVDDGSTDRTPQIADALAEKNPHIKVVHQENQWIYNSFNNGIALAKGEYIYILNSDDQLMPGTFQLFETKVKEYHPDIIWTKVLQHVCDEKQNIIIYDKFNSNQRVVKECFYSSKTEVEKAWPFFISSGLAQNQANLYRREIMQSHLFRNDVYGADTLYNISIADEITSALVLSEPVYSYYIYGNNTMNVSAGKYYTYSHDMYNEIYLQYQALFQKWRLAPEDSLTAIQKRRMIALTTELRELQAFNCPFSIGEKLQFALCGCVDDVIKECVLEGHREEELESRILSGIRELLIQETIDTDNKMYFVYELLESLLRYEKDEEDFRRIERAINHPLNPLHIGRIFYEKLIHGKNKQGRTASEDV
jgi:glycosyltransferase involved in cell wall biosynthesis